MQSLFSKKEVLSANRQANERLPPAPGTAKVLLMGKRSQKLVFGLMSGSFWSLIAGLMLEQFGSGAQSACVLAASLVTGVFITWILAAGLKSPSWLRVALLGVLALPTACFLYGVCFTCFLHIFASIGNSWPPPINSEGHPLDVGLSYAILGCMFLYGALIIPSLANTLLLAKILNKAGHRARDRS